MYKILCRGTDTLRHIVEKMNPYIEERGDVIVCDKKLLKDPIAFSKALLVFKAEMDLVVDKSFDNHMLFRQCCRDSFVNLMNRCKATDFFLAAYADSELKT